MSERPLRLDHLRRLTDTEGIIQHALFAAPDPRTGYTLDDNARALIVAVRHHRRTGEPESSALARRYLRLVGYALTGDPGGPHNFMDIDRAWCDGRASDDAVGRALWALGVAATEAGGARLQAEAERLLGAAIDLAPALRSPRAVAFALLGLAPAAAAGLHPDRAGPAADRLAGRLVDAFRTYADDAWAWFEPYLTYANGRLPESLLAMWEARGGEAHRAVAREATDFLVAQVFPGDGVLDLIGHDGWYVRGSRRAEFDQQPIDAGAMVELLARAHRVLGEPRYGMLAERAMAWFHGANRLGLPLVDEATGGCRDGLHPDRVNQNQGAESVLAYLMARLALDEPAPGRPDRAARRREAHPGRQGAPARP